MSNEWSNTPGGWSNRLAGHATERAQDVRPYVETTARKVGEQGQSVHDAKAAPGQQAERAREYTAGSLEETASALNKVADEIPEGSVRRAPLQEAADGLGQIARSMENRSGADMAREVSDFGRRNSAAFLGGAAYFGLALSRLVHASAGAAIGSALPGTKTEDRLMGQ